MEGLNGKLNAIREAMNIGCSGAHMLPTGEWMPCSSAKTLFSIIDPYSVKGRTLVGNMDEWSSRRKKKGKNRKKRWEKLRERRVLGIGTLQSGGLVSDNGPSGPVVTALGGGKIPGIFNGNPNPPNMPGGLSTKAMEAAYSPRDNDPDVFFDVESARKRSVQLGCIGVSRRVSKSGKTVWMPCTNMTDYNNRTGSTRLGKINKEKETVSAIRTVLKDELKKRKKSISEEILGKALGPKLRSVSRTVTEGFDANAIDGDGDAIIQDGTAFERPAITNAVEAAKNVVEKLPETNEVKLDDADIAIVGNWYSKLSPRQVRILQGSPDASLDGLRSTRRSKPASGENSRILKEIAQIQDFNNPEASPTNPLRNLGGRNMGRIILGFVKRENRGKQDRTTYIIGGNIGAGKSTVLNEHLVPKGLVPDKSEAATIDPDFIKLGIPGYDDGAGAVLVHRDSQKATDKIIESAANEGMDIVLSGTGTSRQSQHISEAKARGEKVVGHYVHIPRDEAAKRIRIREEETGRKIDDNTGRLSVKIPQMVSEKINNGEMDEFYLWDNTVEEGKPPRLIASHKDGRLEIFDQKQFDDFMQGFEIKQGDGEGGLRSVKYDANQARKWLEEIGFEVLGNKETKNKPETFFSKETPIGKFFWDVVIKHMVNQSGRHKDHANGKNGNVVIEEVNDVLGVAIDKNRLPDKRYRAELKELFSTSDPEVLRQIFSTARIKGPHGKDKFGDLTTEQMGVEVDKSAQKTEERLKKMRDKLFEAGIPREELDNLNNNEIRNLHRSIFGDDDESGLRSTNTPGNPQSPFVDKLMAVKVAPGRPRADSSDYEVDIDKIVARSIPTSQQELEQILKDSPFTSSDPTDIPVLIDYIKSLNGGKELDWDRQKQLADLWRKTLEESPAMRKLVSITDVPLMISTENAADGPTGRKPWNSVNIGDGSLSATKTGGMFLNGRGIVLMSPETVGGKKLNLDGRSYTPEYQLRHEVGHAIQYMLANISQDAQDEIRDYYVLAEQDLKRIRKDMLNLAAAVAGAKSKKEVLKIQKKIETLTQQAKQPGFHSGFMTTNEARQLSTYAAVNPFEFFAESIATITAPAKERMSNRGVPYYGKNLIPHIARYMGVKEQEIQDLLELMK